MSVKQVWQNSRGEIFETKTEALKSETEYAKGTWFLDKNACTILPEDAITSWVWYAQFVDYDDFLRWKTGKSAHDFNTMQFNDWDVEDCIKEDGIAQIFWDPMSEQYVLSLSVDFAYKLEYIKRILGKINEP